MESALIVPFERCDSIDYRMGIGDQGAARPCDIQGIIRVCDPARRYPIDRF